MKGVSDCRPSLRIGAYVCGNTSVPRDGRTDGKSVICPLVLVQTCSPSCFQQFVWVHIFVVELQQSIFNVDKHTDRRYNQHLCVVHGLSSEPGQKVDVKSQIVDEPDLMSVSKKKEKRR